MQQGLFRSDDWAGGNGAELGVQRGGLEQFPHSNICCRWGAARAYDYCYHCADISHRGSPRSYRKSLGVARGTFRCTCGCALFLGTDREDCHRLVARGIWWGHRAELSSIPLVKSAAEAFGSLAFYNIGACGYYPGADPYSGWRDWSSHTSWWRSLLGRIRPDIDAGLCGAFSVGTPVRAWLHG